MQLSVYTKISRLAEMMLSDMELANQEAKKIKKNPLKKSYSSFVLFLFMQYR
jgi:hypothetical protein